MLRNNNSYLFVIYHCRLNAHTHFPGGPSKEPACQCRRRERRGFDPWVGKIPWRREWQPTPVFLPGESHGQRRLAGYNSWGHKESYVTEQLSTYTLHPIQFSSVQLFSHLQLFATAWTVAWQASLSITNSWRLPKLMSIESVMPSNHLILCQPLLFSPSIFPSIRVFSNQSALLIRWPKY